MAQTLLEHVLAQIRSDIEWGDVAAMEELLLLIPEERLVRYVVEGSNIEPALSGWNPHLAIV